MNDAPVSWADLWRTFGRIGLLSFGGPAAQIALMHRELVDDRKWLNEQEYLRALSFCMLLPGPEAMQLATYAGWRQRGIPGGLLAGSLFVLPGAIVILALSALYAAVGHVPMVSALFVGVKACVVIIVIEALIRVSKRALKGQAHRAIAVAALILIFFLNVPFPAIVIGAALLGAAILPVAPPGTAPEKALRNPTLIPVLSIGLTIWALPVLVAWIAGASFLVTLGLFFAKLAVVTFGGAYAVLAYMTQAVVQDYGWVTTAQMMDGLGLAETTPGPLILVTAFVGFLAGHAQGGWTLALTAMAMTLWMTFVPCFLWIFAFAPYVEWIATRPRLAAALQGVTAAVVGVIASLGLWFALHLFFGEFPSVVVGPLQIPLPDITALSWRPALIAAASAVLLLLRHWPLLPVLGLSALAGLGLGLIP